MEDQLEMASRELLSLRVRNGIEWLQEGMLCLAQTPIRTRHLFPKGLYVREVFIPKGTLCIGKIHRSEYIDIVSSGAVNVLTEDGIKRVQAPATFVTQPGKKRVGIALEDTVWTTIHPNPENETDLEKLEALLLADAYEEVQPLAGCDEPGISFVTYQCAQPEGELACPR